jgi:ArsR family transcriptional regulator
VKKVDYLDKCDCLVIHHDVVASVKKDLPSQETFSELAGLYKILGDPTRVKILWALDAAEMCVCDIAYLLNMTQSAISHQLRVLKQAKLVKNRRQGKIVFYSLEDEHVKQIFELGLIHISEES